MFDSFHSQLRIAYSFPSRIGVPGIGNTAWQQVNGLVGRGLHVTLICGTCERPIPGLAHLVETMKIERFKIPYRLLGHMRSYRRHDRIAANGILGAAPKFDILHCWPLGSLKTLQAAKEVGTVSFLERPNTHSEHAYNVVARECKALGLTMPDSHSHSFNDERLVREEAEYALADRLACPSQAVAQTFIDRGFSSDHLAMHHYGYDPAIHFPARRDEAQPRKGLVAAFVGSCEPRKGLHHALEAWLKSGAGETGGQLLIVGGFLPNYQEALADKLAHPSIRLCGFSSETARLMQQADVLLLPSIEEGSALVTYEARACGCVLLVSDAAGAFCTHEHDALVHSAGDVKQLTEHLKRLNEDPQLLEQLRKASLAEARNLTWASAAARLHELYADALAAEAPVLRSAVTI